MKAEVRTITPFVAELMLRGNISNRPVRKQRVDMYADDMLNGRWASNGESIVVTESGKLVNGQHRLLAILKANMAFDFTVSIIPDSEAKNFDLCRIRNVKDSVKIYNVGDGTEKLKRHVINACIFIVSKKYCGSVRANVSETEKIQSLHDNIDVLLEFQVFFNPFSSSLTNRSSVAAALLTAYNYGYDKKKLEYFCDILISGMSNRKEDSAIINVRDALLKYSGKTGSKLNAEIFGRVCYALYAFNLGQKGNFNYASSCKLVKKVVDTYVESWGRSLIN